MPELSPKEQIKEINRLRKNISKRVANIEKYGTRASQFASNKFSLLELGLPDNINELDEASRKEVLRTLRYIDSLRSSTVKGAKSTKESWQPIEDKLNVYSETKKKEYWDSIEKLRELVPTLPDRFKYEIFDINMELFSRGYSADEIAHKVKDAYDKMLKGEVEEDGEDEDFLYISEKLKDI